MSIAQATKAKTDKWGGIKLKSFYTAKESISKVKRQPTEQEKILINDISDKKLMSKTYTNSYNSIAKQVKNNLI